MSNYTPTGNPIAETRGTSSLIRNEFALIQTAVNSKADPSTTNTFSALQTFSTITVTGLATLSGGGTYTGTHNFTGGSVTISTQSPGTNNTSAASTAFVTAAVAVETARATSAENLLAPKANPTFTGSPTAPTVGAPTDSTTKLATTAFVQAALASYSGTNLGLPAFTGADADKTLRLNGSGTGYVWVLGATSTETLANKTIVAPVVLASPTTTQDGVILTGRAGGSSSYRVTIAPTTLTASRNITLPDASGTVLLDTTFTTPDHLLMAQGVI